MGCSKMTSFTMPGVEEIGEKAFNWWSSSSLSCLANLPNIRKLGQKAFFEIAGDSVGVSPFTVPATVEEIHSNSFKCEFNINITFDGTNSWTKWNGNTSIDTNVTLTSSDVQTMSSPVYRYTRNH